MLSAAGSIFGGPERRLQSIDSESRVTSGEYNCSYNFELPELFNRFKTSQVIADLPEVTGMLGELVGACLMSLVKASHS